MTFVHGVGLTEPYRGIRPSSAGHNHMEFIFFHVYFVNEMYHISKDVGWVLTIYAPTSKRDE